MRKTFLGIAASAALVAVPLGASAQNYVYEGVINVPVDFPLAMAADASAGLYMANFNPDGGGAVVYIADPVSVIDGSDTFPVDEEGDIIFEVTGWPGQRGFQGLQVDSLGNVYVSGDDGGTTYIRKLTPAPDFTVDATFNVTGTVRIGGVALLGDDVIAAAQFGALYFFDTSDGSALGNVTGGIIYQREPVYNPNDDVVYGLTSGNNSTALLRGYWSGGTPAAPAGYAHTASELITDGSLGTAFGGASAHGYFDAEKNWLITADNEATNRQIRIWDVTNNGTEVTLLQALDGATPYANGDPQPFPMASPRDAVRIGDRIYVSTSNNGGSIYVFIDEDAVTSVGDWDLFH